MKRTWLAIWLCVMLPSAPGQFKSESRLVEIYATVHDHGNKYVDGLAKESFQILDNGAPQLVTSFESENSELSCALLIDTTASMTEALPVVKNAVRHFVDSLRVNDWVAIYAFDSSLNLLQDFTQDKTAAKRAALRTRAGGSTALFDSLVQVTREVGGRHGKKVIVVFTDGDDNASVLQSGAASARAKKAGVPVYTVLEGEALKNGKLIDQLRDISKATGAESYRVKKVQEMDRVFEDIVSDLNHTYLLAYRPPTPEKIAWRSIEIKINGWKDYKVRAKEGYIPE